MKARLWSISLAACFVTAAVAFYSHTTAQDRIAPPAAEQPISAVEEKPKNEAAEAAVRKNADAFTAAFNKGDAKSIVALMTKEVEYNGPDGETISGRDALEKSYVDFFKDNPKATIEVQISGVRPVGRQTAIEEGTLKLTVPGKPISETRYSVLHVHEEEGWRMATVREWLPNPAELVTLKDVEWLIGDWEAKGNEAELSISYAWDEDKAYIRGRYTLKKGGKVVSSGSQVIGKDPAAGLRSWVFEGNGSFGESNWNRDGDRWVIDAGGTLPDGSETSATNILIPLSKDAFTWQSTERTAAGASLPDLPPVKVTRVKK